MYIYVKFNHQSDIVANVFHQSRRAVLMPRDEYKVLEKRFNKHGIVYLGVNTKFRLFIINY